MKQSPLEWARGPRSAFDLGHDVGVYALFLSKGAALPGVIPGEQGLLYIGLAANRKGLKGRCHFDARTRNHSPRKSLAAVLMDTLLLTPMLITKPNSPATWGLDEKSDTKLSQWMHDNLRLGIDICADPNSRETELVSQHAPPLNLTKCVQTEQHRSIAELRASVMANLQGRLATPSAPPHSANGTTPQSGPEAIGRKGVQSSSYARNFLGTDVDTAKAIAARFLV